MVEAVDALSTRFKHEEEHWWGLIDTIFVTFTLYTITLRALCDAFFHRADLIDEAIDRLAKLLSL